jgi:uncharacterized repeat protein (TIGR03803 family)
MMTKVGCLFIVLAVSLFPAGADAQAISTLTVLHNFGITNQPPENLTAPVVQGPDGTLYGTSSQGGFGEAGTVFKIQPNGTGLTVLKSFTNSPDGQNPQAGLVLSGSTLYGATSTGGATGNGTVFAVNTDGTGFTNLYSFQGWSDGANPQAGLVLSGGKLFGTTQFGGAFGNGTVFTINIDGTDFINLYNFSNGANPKAGLISSGNTLYGTTSHGGTGSGTVFAINSDGTGFTNLYIFSMLVNNTNNDGAYPVASLILSGSTLFGTAQNGGLGGSGTLFAISTNGTGFTNFYSFTSTIYELPNGSGGSPGYTNSDGANPYAPLLLSGNTLYGTTSGGGTNGQGTVFAVGTNGVGFATFHNFAGGGASDGGRPVAGLILSGSILYGTTSYGGSQQNDGTLFSISTNGTGYANAFNFGPINIGDPWAGLVLSDGVLYGTTEYGGANDEGTVFAVNTNGTAFTILHSFSALVSGNNSDGAHPQSALLLSGGTLFGTAPSGGSKGGGGGTLFSINTNGTGFTVVHTFGGGGAVNGRLPVGGLASSGSTLFGTANNGGSSDEGIIFRINTDGSDFTNLYNFSPLVSGTNRDGANPVAALILSGSTLYGTTTIGGTNGNGTVFAVNTGGTGYTVLHTFNTISSGTNSGGVNPKSALVLSGGALYGTTSGGGANGYGTVFAVNADGTGFATLYNFPNVGGPDAGLILSGPMLFGTLYNNTVFAINTNGTGYVVLYNLNGTSEGNGLAAGLTISGSTLYGTASDKGFGGNGTVFAVTPLPIPLNLQSASNAVVLNWLNPLLSLQSGPTVNGTYTNIPAAYSPFTNYTTAPQQFFRLIAN